MNQTARQLDGEIADQAPRFQRARERLVASLSDLGILDQRVLEALRGLPRHLFVEEALAGHAYLNKSLPIGQGQTISQPYTVARMTEALFAAGDCDRVLEIGTGCGYQTAVLAQLARRVYSVERISLLSERAERLLRALRIRNVRLRHGDGVFGWPEYAPFDGILVTAAGEGVPRQLAEQLAEGGSMVMPLDRGDDQVLMRLTRTQSGYRHELLESVTFVPLLTGVL